MNFYPAPPNHSPSSPSPSSPSPHSLLFAHHASSPSIQLTHPPLPRISEQAEPQLPHQLAPPLPLPPPPPPRPPKPLALSTASSSPRSSYAANVSSPSNSPSSSHQNYSPRLQLRTLARSPNPSPHLNQGNLSAGPSTGSPTASTFGSVYSPLSPSTPYASSHCGLSPLIASGSPMALRPPQSGFVAEYNPQQWARTAPTSASYLPHSALAATAPPRDAEDGVPSPPPPYSPPHSQSRTPHQNAPPASTSSNVARPPLPYLQTSVSSSAHPEFSSPMSATTVVSPLSVIDRTRQGTRQQISSPLNPRASSMTSFPPPPGRDRSGSRNRPEGSRSRFGLSALTRGKSSDRTATASSQLELTQQNASGSSSRQNTPPQFAQPRPLNGAACRSTVYVESGNAFGPPAARRAVSAGPTPQTPQGLQSNWDSGMTYPPPPPPGPPPASNRSASLSSPRAAGAVSGSIEVGNMMVPILSMPTRRSRQSISTLETIPPTPAGWADLPSGTNQSRTAHTESQVNDQHANSSFSLQDPPAQRQPSPGPSSNSLTSDSVSRDGGQKGIRERRSESRAARDRAYQDSSAAESSTAPEAKPADLVLTPPSGGGISRQGAFKKSRTTSPQEAKSSPKVTVLPRRLTGSEPSYTPPFSPGERARSKSRVIDAGMSSKPHPAPPPPECRPGSSGQRSMTSPSLNRKTEHEMFVEASLDRHRSFVEKEKNATTDRQRLELFAEYIVAESRLRRDRYSVAFSAMAGDIFDLTRDLWRSYQSSPIPQSASLDKPSDPISSAHPRTQRTESFGSRTTASGGDASWANFTPRTETDSPSSVASSNAAGTGSAPQREGAWTYQPVLSPIPSMAMSTVPDEDQEQLSRGRSISRWWESDHGSSGGSQRIERSKRESKYMGLHREARLNLQYEAENSPGLAGNAGNHATSADGASSSDYPPEKVGWHAPSSQHDDTPGFYESAQATPKHSVPNTPSATPGLDVSRLVTLPPPYPRHYPAMANSHPDLASIRATLRALNDLSEIRQTKEDFATRIEAARAVASQDRASRTAQMRHNITEQVRLGQMTYSQAAAAEESFHASEAEEKLTAARKEFEEFQPKVVNPLHALLSERVTRASACVGSLTAGLRNSAGEAGPEAPMEEGDERPELLEKLKLLKWLVEAREACAREMHELENERCDRYRGVVLADLRAKKADSSKLVEAEQFFRRDEAERRAKFEKEARTRVEEFAATVETHVSRGVEDQLSAFWDIAPGLREIVTRVPADEEALAYFRIAVPHAEIAENPGFGDFPLQYLFGLLCHAEKSAYQFIENQVGLLCLLHEVGIAVMRAGLRVVLLADGERGQVSEEEMTELGEAEEARLTRELKERVGVVEGQWRDALGGELSECTKRVERVLREIGGWDEALRE